jgi:hypothetical protein
MIRILCLFLGLLVTACGGAAFSFEPADLAKDAAPSDDAASAVEAAPAVDAAPDAVTADVTPTSDVAEAGSTCGCSNDLSNVGVGDFRIAFTIATTASPVAPGFMALVNQRSLCNPTHSGWDVWLSPAGTIWVEVYDGTNVFDNVQSAVVINDGLEHRIVIQRSQKGTLFQITIDGATLGYPGAPVEALSGSLALLSVGTDPTCASNAGQPSEPFVGALTAVCVGGCAL